MVLVTPDDRNLKVRQKQQSLNNRSPGWASRSVDTFYFGPHGRAKQTPADQIECERALAAMGTDKMCAIGEMPRVCKLMALPRFIKRPLLEAAIGGRPEAAAVANLKCSIAQLINLYRRCACFTLLHIINLYYTFRMCKASADDESRFVYVLAAAAGCEGRRNYLIPGDLLSMMQV